MYLYSYLDSINLENKIIPKFENVSLEHLLIKSLSEERLSNQEQVSLINQDLIKEAKVNMKELHLSSKPNQNSDYDSNKCRSRDYYLAKISNKCRWSKQEDIKLFKALKAICQKLNIDISRIKLSKGKVNKLHRNLLKSIKTEVGWKGTLIELKDRIIKVRSADKFTARETRVLKRYLSKLADGLVSIEQVLEQFPGKTEEQILEFQYNN